VKIGVLDSGAGGLTILNVIRKKIPALDLLYFADSAFAPYGEKSPEQIQSRLIKIGEFLEKQGVDAIVVACNTATVVAIDVLRAHTHLPVIGVEPAVKPAFRVSKKRRVAVLATPLTAQSHRLKELIELWRSDSQVQIMSSPTLAFEIDQWPASEVVVDKLVKELCQHMLEAEVDTLVLACTHYPLVKQIFIRYLGENCEIIEPSEGVTAQLYRRLQEAYPYEVQGLARSEHRGSIELVSTKDIVKAQSLRCWVEDQTAPIDVRSVSL